MSEPVVQVTYALTDDDQLAFAWDNLIRRLAPFTVLIVGGSLVLLVATQEQAFLAVTAGGVGGSAFMGLTGWYQTRSAVLAQLRARPLHGSTLTLTARPEGLEISGAERVLHGWSLVGKPKITWSSLTFPVGHATKLLVPRRAFADKAAERAFRDALIAGRRSPASLPEPEDDGPYVYDLTYLSPYDDLVALNRWFMNRQEPPERLRRTV